MAPSPSSSSTTSVQVAVRIRPTTTQDTTSIPARFQRSVIHAASSNSVAVEANVNVGGPGGAAAPPAAASAKKQVFNFDQVHGPPTTQHQMFTTTAQPLISRFLEGFNCTILAYGQTSSGKTFTMTGIDLDADPSDPNNGMGIIPRAVSTIFSRAKQLKEEKAGTWNYSVKGSFIEIYNEDLIDLLSMDDPSGGRREVQIREDKDGHIIWGGLREVSVKNANEVMTLIRKGTAIRRTNETDMNAQSSRSHAIFSLTLTQKKRTGSGGAQPRSSSPLPTGRSPSRLARPGSLYSGPSSAGVNRVGSPTFGRPPTPSFASAMGRGGGLRPSSALGHSSEKMFGGGDDDAGEWVTIVSKFHFVDLAGSERLKRTAAAGERIKEGISINSGLLALGNVISALGDPSRAKSHTASHVPYRDSKLTRLLQDSLGGNAHTLMIACVSPAEWNAGETINTLKYANRARNIKNRATVNEKEDGFDDIEWLQGTVTRLRKELKALKEGGAVPSREGQVPEVVLEGAGKKVLAQMTELQNNYEDLREKFVERTEELTRLRRELGESHRGGSGTVTGTAKYEEIVGPVIEEYEKAIATMEAELTLNRAALRHTNEMVDEKEEELAALTDRHAATELYVEELRARAAKLTEREASTEAYVRDLEEKLKAYDETSITSSGSITDLKRELSKFKDSEGHSAKYIADLEARLARSDESVLGLQQTIEKLEKECERRRDEVEILESRLESLRKDGEGWRSDLEERERRVKELEEKMEQWEQKRQDASDARERLGEVVEEVASARRSLQLDMANAVNGDETPPTVNGHSRSLSSETPPEPSSDLQKQFVALQETHTATLADLSSVTAKYRDALREISDLAAQIQEAKLNNDVADSPVQERMPESPVIRRRVTSGRLREQSEHNNNNQGRRLFFRHAASTESLHSRSLSQSQSLSQELSSVHSRKTSSSSHGSSHSPSNSHGSFTPMTSRPNLSISLPNTATVLSPSERSVISLEKEIMRLQEVLKERETEISVLEKSLRQKSDDSHLPNGNAEGPIASLSPGTINQFEDIRRSMEVNGNGYANDPETESEKHSDSDESLERLNELMLSMAQKESAHKELVDDLNEQLRTVKRQFDDLTTLSRDQAINMSSEIEALTRKHTADLEKLEEVQAHEAELMATLERVHVEHAEAMEQLRVEHQDAVKAMESAAHGDQKEFLEKVYAEHAAALEQLHAKHQEALKAKDLEQDNAIASLIESHATAIDAARETLQKSLTDDHASALSKALTEHAEASKQKDTDAAAVLQQTEEDYYNALTKLRADHSEALASQAAEAAAALARLREDHASELRQIEIAREGTLSESQSSQALALQQLRDEHAAALSRKDASFEQDIKRLRDEHSRLFSEAASVSSQTRAELEASIEDLKSQHTAALREAERAHQEELEMFNASHEDNLKAIRVETDTKAAVVLKTHTEEILKLKAGHAADIAELNNSLVDLQEEHSATLERLREEHRLTLEEERGRLMQTLEDLNVQHASERDTLRKDHELLVQEVEAYKSAADEFTLLREQARESHEQALEEKVEIIEDVQRQLSEVEADRDDLAAQVARLRSELEKTRREQTTLIQEASKRESLVFELERHRSVLAEMQENLQKVKDEKDTLYTEKSRSDSLLRELQEKIARSASPPNGRPTPERTHSGFNRTATGTKLPPPTPPPSVPPPPAPRTAQHQSSELSISSSSSGLTSASSTRESQPESPSTSIGHASSPTPTNHDPKLATRLEHQAKQIEEQEAMIKTLNKQLTHCESDLQTHMDLVSTLETSLGDSEKNLRKARMHATELARERDTLNTKLEALRNELNETKREVVTVRKSIVEEKQSYEQRLDEERKAKERARQQLDARMEELTLKRKSKFGALNCL